MKNSSEYAKKFKTLCKKLPAQEAVVHADGPVAELIYSQLLWNATKKQADTAYRKLMKASIDLNDLRMNMPQETIEIIGTAYPQAEDRARRLRATLRAIYLREHDVTFTSLSDAGKTEAKEYIQTLEGITHFVSGRVLSLCFGVSVFPVDDRTYHALRTAGVLHEDASLDEVAIWLSRQVKANEVSKVHGRIHAWAEKQPVRKTAPKSAATKAVTAMAAKKKAAKKKTSNKKSKK